MSALLVGDHGDAEILLALEEVDFPSERCAHRVPVSPYDGQAVLVTEYVPGRAPAGTGGTFRLLGELLAAGAATAPGATCRRTNWTAWRRASCPDRWSSGAGRSRPVESGWRIWSRISGRCAAERRASPAGPGWRPERRPVGQNGRQPVRGKEGTHHDRSAKRR